MSDKELSEAVMKLHDIARLIENKIGTGGLSKDVRSAADVLNDLIKRA